MPLLSYPRVHGVSEARGRRLSSEDEVRALGQMLVDLNEAERLLTTIHRSAIAHGEDDVLRYLDSELFWKLRAAGDVLREHFDMERVHGGQM
jgi:hypothetical protein